MKVETIRFSFCPACLVAAFTIFVSGCSEEPSARTYDQAGLDQLVATPTSSNHYRWPVAGDTWQAAKPTDFTLLRKVKPGTFGRVADEIAAKNSARIEEASRRSDPAHR